MTRMLRAKFVDKFKTRSILNNVFSKIVAFMRKCGKLWYSSKFVGYTIKPYIGKTVSCVNACVYTHTNA